MKFYFQIKETGKPWEEISPIARTCKSRMEAIRHAKRLSKISGMEVRLTDNENLFSGTYIKES